MNESTLAQTIAEIARPLAASLDLGVWGVEAMSGKGSVIRVYVEGGNGVDIDACAELSRLLGLALDVEDVIPGAYVLEVSSPGLERIFFTPEQLAGYVDSVVDVSLHEPKEAYPGRKKLLGKLTGAANGLFTLIPLDAPPTGPYDTPPAAVFAWTDVKKAKLVHFLPETPKPARGGKTKTPKPARATVKKAAGNDGEDAAT